MRLKRFLAPIFAVSLFTLVHPAFSQTAPAAYSGHQLPFSVGAGVSNIDVDWGKSRMYGGTLWIEYFPPHLPHLIDGLSVDVEARDINYDRPRTVPSNFRQDTAGGGPMYTWRRFPNFQIYGKGPVEFGSFDFTLTGAPHYHHETRTVFAPGGGILAHAYKHVWVRADYEYQFWPDLLPHDGPRTADPQGFTLGAVYDFRGLRR
jgi:Outer membrane protein beta-barrel domain